MTPVPSATIPPRRRPLVKRPWFWALMSLIGLVIVFGVMFAAAVPLSSDTLRHRIVSYLSDQLDSDVELGDLHFRAFPRLRLLFETRDKRVQRTRDPIPRKRRAGPNSSEAHLLSERVCDRGSFSTFPC